MNKLLTPVFFVLSWGLWALGEFFFYMLEANDDSEKWVAFWYKPYNGAMVNSYQAQEFVKGDGKFWPWEVARSQ